MSFLLEPIPNIQSPSLPLLRAHQGQGPPSHIYYMLLNCLILQKVQDKVDCIQWTANLSLQCMRLDAGSSSRTPSLWAVMFSHITYQPCLIFMNKTEAKLCQECQECGHMDRVWTSLPAQADPAVPAILDWPVRPYLSSFSFHFSSFLPLTVRPMGSVGARPPGVGSSISSHP